MTRLGDYGARLYRGDVSYDFVGRQRVWYALSAVILVVSLGGLLARGLELGIEFRGGSEFQLTAPTATVEEVRSTVTDAGVEGESRVQKIGDAGYRVQTPRLSSEQATEVQRALASKFGIDENDVSTQFIGASWGADISRKAVIGLLVFLGLVVLVMSVIFELKMAIAALVALAHDVLITVGVYAFVGFEVTPATVIGLLTILGYSLYDTVVVFDKVRENTAGIAGGSRMTYSDAANLALNQTLVRSINTSVVALLPVGAILFVGAGLLGAGTLKDLALALFVGMLAGTYSSIFIATPLLADLKEREKPMQALRRRVSGRQAAGPAPAARRAGASRGAARGPAGGADGDAAAGSGTGRRRTAVLEPGDDVDDGVDGSAEEAAEGNVAEVDGGDGVRGPSGTGATAATARPARPGARPGAQGRPGSRQQPRRSPRSRPSGKKKR